MSDFDKLQAEFNELKARVDALTEPAKSKKVTLMDRGIKRVGDIQKTLAGKPYKKVGDLPAKEEG